MKVSRFAELVALSEGGKRPQSIAQIKETLRYANIWLNGGLYKLIRAQSEEVPETADKV